VPWAAKTILQRGFRERHARRRSMIVFEMIEPHPERSATVPPASRASPAWPPSASPKSWDLEHGTHTIIVIFVDGNPHISAQRGGAAGS
jgi:hypothetical protein